MQLLLVLVVAIVVIGLIYRMTSAKRASLLLNSTPAPRSEHPVTFLSNGLIFLRERGGILKQVKSVYAQEAQDRRERSRVRQSWKEGTSFNIAAGGGRRTFEEVDKPLVATTAAYEPNGDLLYFLRDDHMGGLFRQEAESGRELRVVLKQNLHLTDLCVAPEGVLLAASSLQTGGVANIALMDSDGSKYHEVTGGDTIDSSPAWIPGFPKLMLYQSAGLARNEQGHIAAIGNASIQKLDLDSGSVSPVLEDPAFDYLKPRVTPRGDLLFVRRPYEGPRYGINAVLADMILFPFRLLRAVFHYLNFFSLMYTRKPLTSANGPATEADIKNILLQGKRIDAEKAMRNARLIQGVPSLVPDSWQLVKRDQNGNEQILASNVASYDIGADGTIVYSNGCGVFVISHDGSSQLAISDQLVSEVVAVAT